MRKPPTERRIDDPGPQYTAPVAAEVVRTWLNDNTDEEWSNIAASDLLDNLRAAGFHLDYHGPVECGHCHGRVRYASQHILAGPEWVCPHREKETSNA